MAGKGKWKVRQFRAKHSARQARPQWGTKTRNQDRLQVASCRADWLKHNEMTVPTSPFHLCPGFMVATSCPMGASTGPGPCLTAPC